MRHALVPVHLIHSARAAASQARFDAEPETDETYGRPVRRGPVRCASAASSP